MIPQSGEDPGNRLPEFGKFFFDDHPHGIQVHAHILVDQDVPEAGDPAPGDLRMLQFQGVRDLLHGFADDLKFRITASCTIGESMNASRPPRV